MDTASQSRLFSFFRILSQDMGYSLRQLRKSPAFALVAVGSLALGIGASVAIFSVVRAVLLDPFPYKDADRMVHVELTQKNSDRYDYLMVTTTELRDLQQVAAVDDVFLMNNRMQALTGDALPVSVRAGYYSTNLFTYMSVPPLMGRAFTPADVSNGNANSVAVLGYLFWKRQFGGRQDTLNRRIELDHVPYTVIGVASPRFTWGDSDVYIPSLFNADAHVYESAFVKLKRGASYAAASAALQVLVDGFARQDPADYPQHSRVRIEALRDEAMHGFKTPLLVLFGAVPLLLLIGCANVSILLLARGAARQQEFAVRASLGASRSRIARQLLVESMMLSLLGAAAGVVLAFGGVTLLAAHMPPYSFPHEAAIHVNGTVLLFAVAIGLLTGIVFGSSPAWKLSHAEMGLLIQGSSARLAGRSHDRHLHRLLIGGQMVLTMLLLAGAGAAMRAFLQLVQTPMGFDPSHLFFTVVSVPRGGNHTWQYLLAQQEMYRQAIEATPGVTAVSLSPTWMPPPAPGSV
jgi:predicted permease